VETLLQIRRDKIRVINAGSRIEGKKESASGSDGHAQQPSLLRCEPLFAERYSPFCEFWSGCTTK